MEPVTITREKIMELVKKIAERERIPETVMRQSEEYFVKNTLPFLQTVFEVLGINYTVDIDLGKYLPKKIKRVEVYTLPDDFGDDADDLDNPKKRSRRIL